ncbi:unnamed protein product [Closterium sp. NIES-64]|nr:unnamed protein product [Closterium sp. NIES-64]
MIESTTSDLVERYLTPEKAFGDEGKSWLVTFLKVHKEGGGKQVRVRGVDGAGRAINHLYTMHERKLKGHKHGSTYADCVKLCRKFARDCVDNLTNRLDDLGKLGPTKLFRAGKWPKIKAQREKKCPYAAPPPAPVAAPPSRGPAPSRPSRPVAARSPPYGPAVPS